MPAKGSGVQTVEDLKARSIVSEVTECWRWQGALHKERKSNEGRWAAIWIFDPVALKSCVVSGARAAAIVAKLPLFRGWRAWLTCDRPDCVNPAHVKTGTKANWGAWMAANGRMRENASHRIGIQKAWERNLPERAAAARAVLNAPQDVTNKELVQQLGLHKSVVSAIRLGKKWAHLRGPHPFDGLGAR